MKLLLATAVLATLASSSAYAWRGDYRSHAQVSPYAASRSHHVNRARAQVPPRATSRSRRVNRAYAQVPPYAYGPYGRAYAPYGPYGRAYAPYGPYGGAYAQVPPYAAYGPYGAYAQVPTPNIYDVYGRRAPYPYSVYDIRGEYVGSDPDPRVRDQLARDPTQGGE
jgi:hypothetical protein